MAPDRLTPVVAITVGDCNGIGPEVALKGASSRAVRRLCKPVLIGSPKVFDFYARKLSLPGRMTLSRDNHLHSNRTHVLPVLSVPHEKEPVIRPGRVSASAGRHAAAAIRYAVALALEGKVDALVTAPVSKKALHMAGDAFPGQTEMLAHLTGSGSTAMMLVSDVMRVGLVTIHIPLRDVAATLNRTLLGKKISVIHDALRFDWRIRQPRVAVLGLNPHAGEQGDLGSEEQRLLLPVISSLRRKGMSIAGPFPADSFFGKYTPGSFDAVVAMYHDQGLVPLKMSSFGRGVNFTAGLNIVRTSPDHGTAFDIAGKGLADPRSMIEAIALAVAIARNRKAVKNR